MVRHILLAMPRNAVITLSQISTNLRLATVSREPRNHMHSRRNWSLLSAIVTIWALIVYVVYFGQFSPYAEHVLALFQRIFSR